MRIGVAVRMATGSERGGGVAGELGRLLGEVAAEEQILERDVLAAPRLAGGSLLGHEACGGEHGEPAVAQLLLLHLTQLRRVGRLEPERIKAEVARVVVGLQRLHVFHLLVRVGPPSLD